MLSHTPPHTLPHYFKICFGHQDKDEEYGKEFVEKGNDNGKEGGVND